MQYLRKSLVINWTLPFRGTLVMTLKNNGNQLVLSGPKGDMYESFTNTPEALEMRLNASQVRELELLLRVARANVELNSFSIPHFLSI